MTEHQIQPEELTRLAAVSAVYNVLMTVNSDGLHFAQIRQDLAEQVVAAAMPHLEGDLLAAMARQQSASEARADEAERAVKQAKIDAGVCAVTAFREALAARFDRDAEGEHVSSGGQIVARAIAETIRTFAGPDAPAPVSAPLDAAALDEAEKRGARDALTMLAASLVERRDRLREKRTSSSWAAGVEEAASVARAGAASIGEG